MSFAQSTLDFVTQPAGLLKFVLVLALVTGLIMEQILKALMAWVAKKDWWPRAMPLQKHLMMNFGYPEASLTEAQTRASYAYVIALCTHHFLAGFALLPVVMHGWEGAGVSGRCLFVVGVLADVSLDIYDEFRMFSTTFLYDKVGKKLFGGEPCPKEFFIVLGVLHHPLAMIMVCPLVLYYPELHSFHVIAVALLLAAGICFTTGSYKFTLDMTNKFDWFQFKSIVVLQTVTILYTRGYIWFFNLYLIMCYFWSNSTGFFVAGCFAGTLMSLFNVVMIMDAVGAAVKWLPRGMVKEGSDEHAELKADIVNLNPPTSGKGALKGTIMAAQMLGLTPAQAFRANVKVVVAAARFKGSLAKNKDANKSDLAQPLRAS